MCVSFFVVESCRKCEGQKEKLHFVRKCILKGIVVIMWRRKIMFLVGNYWYLMRYSHVPHGKW